MSTNIKRILMILIVSSFTFSSFAAVGYHRGYTVCRGGTCHHGSVNKGCVNGHCGTVRHGSTWNRY